MSIPIFEIRDLSIEVSGRTILSNISFEIPPQSVFAILGPSGVGKSSLLRCLNRLIDEEPGFQTQGDILFKGRSIWSKAISKHELRRQVGIVFQKPTIFPISISENVLFAIRHLNLASKRKYASIAQELLEKVLLWDEVKDRLADSALALSVGQQQRLSIARALALKPAVLLMDEPTSSLDPFATRQIELLMETLSHEHSVVLVTHQIEQSKRLSKTILSLFQGKMAYLGAPEGFVLHEGRWEPML